MNMESQVYQVDLNDIIPNRFQPRLSFDENALNELSSSIKEHGIIQPLVLRKLGDKYEIIAGERRYKASQLAGLKTVPAIITDIDDNKSAEIAIVENLQRKNLTAIEEARSYKKLLDRGYLTQEQLAEKMGVSQPSIANKLRLLNLSDKVQDALLNEKISERHARSLLSIKDKNEQDSMLNKIISERLTVKQLDAEIKNLYMTPTETEDIEMVDVNPNINDIKMNAVDINKEVTKPSFENIFNQSSPMPSVKPLEQNITETEPNNKFFNFLEDDKIEVEPLPINPTTVSENIQESNINIFDSPVVEPTNNVENKQENIYQNENLNIFDLEDASPSITETNHNNEETNNFEIIDLEEDSIDEMSTSTEINASNNMFANFNTPVDVNRIESENVFANQTVFDPMNKVSEIANEENIEALEIEQKNNNLKDAINAVRELSKTLQNAGFNVNLDEMDLESFYQINIKIDK